MGSSAQVDALKATKMIPPPPATTDAGNSPIDAVDGRFHDSHEFVVHIDSVTGVSAVEGRSWGEGDCFVKYSFPTQTAGGVSPTSNTQQRSFFPPSLALKSFQTPAVPLVSDPVIGYSNKHSIVLPSSSSTSPNSIHRLLLHATAASNHSVPIEFWVRFYTPSVVEKMIGKCSLPLEELRNRVMKEGGASENAEDGGKFRVRLNRVDTSGRVEADPSNSAASSIGLVHFGISYLRQRLDVSTPASTEEQRAMESLRQFQTEAPQVVPLAVVVHKACGLKTLAKVDVKSRSLRGFCSTLGKAIRMTLST